MLQWEPNYFVIGQIKVAANTGFDCNSWETRSSEKHKRDALRSKNVVTATMKKETEKETGAHFLELYRLPYYEPIRMQLSTQCITSTWEQQNMFLWHGLILVS